MADDRMRNDDRDLNLGSAGNQGQKKQGNMGQQTPGHGQQDDDDFSTGKRGAGQRSEPGHMEDDFGSGEQGLGQGSKNQGGKGSQNY